MLLEALFKAEGEMVAKKKAAKRSVNCKDAKGDNGATGVSPGFEEELWAAADYNFRPIASIRAYLMRALQR